jgi:RNA polymerase sigma-70 factor, ECF subfamily
LSKTLDRDVVEELYRRYWFQVERRARRILRNADEALDASQEVFIRLMTKGGDFRGESSWMTWLYRVTTNVCLNRLRKRKRTESSEPEVELKPDPQSGRDWGNVILGRRDFIRALHRSDKITQQIVIYHFVDELPQDQVGELVGLSRISVNIKIQKFRALLTDA